LSGNKTSPRGNGFKSIVIEVRKAKSGQKWVKIFKRINKRIVSNGLE